MELEDGRFQGLGLADGIRKQPQGVQAEGLLHGLVQIQLTLLKGTNGQTGLGGFAEPTGRAGDVLDPL